MPGDVSGDSATRKETGGALKKGNEADIVFEDLFDPTDLQRLQDLFADAWGVAALITRPDGTPVTQPSNFTYFCSEFVRKTEKGFRKCQISDAVLGRHNPSGPIIQTCLSAGLWGAGASITIGGRHIGNWLIGQVRNEAQSEERIVAYAHELGADEASFREAFLKVPIMPQEKFEQIAHALSALANQLSASAYQSIRQARLIAEMKQTEEALRESEKRLNEAQRIAQLGHWTWDVKTGEVEWSDEVFRIFQLDPLSFTPRIDSILALSPWPEDHERDKELIRKATESHERGTYEQRFLRPDGSVGYYASSFRGEYDDRGNLLRIAGTVQDVTERKKAEETLWEAKEAAEAATQAKSLFLANMSHEIRTPLNAIVGLTHLALKSGSGVKQREYLTKIQGSSRILLGIVDDLLDVSKIDAGKLKIESEPVRLDSLIQQISSMTFHKAKAKGIGLSFEVSPDVPAFFKSDALRLGQVLLNLVGNAVKFTPVGEVSVLADIVDRLEGRMKLRFTIRDTGIGIPPEHSSSLFQPFDQVDGSTTRRYGGAGLGLFISKKIVEAMGGEIVFESTPGVGSRFSFTVDIGLIEGPDGLEFADRAARKRASELEASGQLATKRILVVEDNDINMQIVREILEEFGASTDGADNGRDAVRMIREAVPPYDAVLMDVQMPEMDGYDVTREIRANPETSSLPIIATTAHTGESERRRCLDAGMNDYVGKPIDPGELVMTVLRWVGTQESIAQAQTIGDLPKDGGAALPSGRTAVIDVETAVRRLSGNRKLFLKLIRDFSRDHSGAADRIRDALGAGEEELAYRIAHTLKGVSGNLSLIDVHDISAAVETAIAGRYEEGMESLLDRLGESVAAAVDEGKRLLAAENESGKGQSAARFVDPAAASTLLKELHDRLTKRNVRARKLFVARKSELQTPETEPFLDDCEAALDKLDFNEAKEHLSRVAQILGVALGDTP